MFPQSYRTSHAYLATHMPLPHTVVDLWRMVQDNHCNTIIMLNEWEENDEVRTGDETDRERCGGGEEGQRRRGIRMEET